MQEACLTYTTSHLHHLQGKSHCHHYTDRKMEAQGGDGIDWGHSAMKAKPRPRLRESPYRPLWLLLPVGYCMSAHRFLLHPQPARLASGTSPVSSGNLVKTRAISTWGCSLPNTSPCVLALPPQGQGQSEWHQADSVTWQLSIGARGRSCWLWQVCAGAGETQQAAWTPLVICLWDPSQCHVLQTHDTSPRCWEGI